MENRFLNQLIPTRTDVDKKVEPFPFSTDSVEKFSRDKLILVFHNHVLKQPEECKSSYNFAATLRLNWLNRFVENYFWRLSDRSSNSL